MFFQYVWIGEISCRIIELLEFELMGYVDIKYYVLIVYKICVCFQIY